MIRTLTEGLLPKALVVLAAFALSSVLFASSTRPAHAADFTVTNTNDSGAGSLRQAILDANANTGADTIRFNIPKTDPGHDPTTGVFTISPTSALPNITEQVTINGYTQPGSKPNTNGPRLGDNAVLKVELNGSSAGANAPGLSITSTTSGNSKVRGLVINRFAQYGILLSGQGNVVEGNFIGTDASGTSSANSSGNSLGNGIGVYIIAAGSVTGNNTVGGTTPAARNVISGNITGVAILTSNPGNLVQGNLIGTSASGTGDLGNSQYGVVIGSVGDGNVVGGTTAAARNIISGNGSGGVLFYVSITGSQTQGHFVRGNYIGTDVKGTGALGNSGDGVFLNGSCGTVKDNVIGGTAAEEGNVIAFNSSAGVRVGDDSCSFNPAIVSSAFGNAILSNSIYDNSELGIDLNPNGVTPNDTGDGDTGANRLQNVPVLTSAKSSRRGTTVKGTLNSTASTTFTVQFFSGPAMDLEGKKFLGQKSVTTDASGNASFTFKTKKKVGKSQEITTTATSPSGDTSEFSASKVVQ